MFNTRVGNVFQYGERERPVPRFGQARRHPELERLICAAGSNHQFAQLLVSAPEVALNQYEYRRHLSGTERDMVLSIQATDIYDFAGQLHSLINQCRK